MSRSFLTLVALAPAFAALASCATVSGLADKEVVDCPGGCSDDAGTSPTNDGGPTNDATSTTDAPIDTGPPPCDPAKDDACLALPAGGWTLAARTPLVGTPPSCPTGFGTSTNVGESPTAQANACACDGCTVTTQASCAGQVAHQFDSATTCANTGGATFYTDPTPGQCQTDLFTGNRMSTSNKFTLPVPSGGACTGSAAVHSDRFNWSNNALLCDATTRCSQGICDARISAPFALCVAHEGATQCPAGFTDRHVVGTQGDADCSASCGCSLNRAPCAGTMSHYTDANCTNGIVTHVANGMCLATALNGTFLSYKVIAASVTSCSANGSSSASNARPKDPRTICCR